MNAQILNQFGELGQFYESIKAKSVHNLMAEDEIMIENILLGIKVDHNGAIIDIVDAGNESDTGDVDEEDVDDVDFN